MSGRLFGEMREMQPYIIFALARTGSTTLLRLLNCRQGLRCAFEPFNPTNMDPILAECYRRRAELGVERIVASLWRVCNGFKHTWGMEGWPFPDEPDLNRRLLVGTGCQIILLHRRNLLRRAISLQISDQMQLWTPNSAQDFRRIREHRFSALDLVKLKKEIEAARLGMAWARKELFSNGIRFRELAYEDLLEPSLTVESRIETLQSIFEFLGAGRETEQRPLAAMQRLLNPEITGFRNAESYEKIPNIREVEEQLGSIENGFVFWNYPGTETQTDQFSSFRPKGGKTDSVLLHRKT
jgi:hypothetical protein